MSEKLYTIPINEVFDKSAADPSCGCPFCTLYSKLEEDNLEITLGASMMEPDTRIKMNEQGFCPTHFGMMLRRKNRLSLALILESHLDLIRSDVEKGGLASMIGGTGSEAPRRIKKLEESCYVCSRIDASFDKMLSNAAYLWQEEQAFREKLAEQPYICLPHMRAWLEKAKDELPKKQYAEFYRDVSAVVYKYFDELRDDISRFVKKFDYRYESEPWGNAKDSPERAVKFLSCDIHREE